MQLCKIEKCNKKICAKGYCQYHYNKHGRPRRQCIENGCTDNNYIKGFCHKHHEYYRRNPTYRINGDICQAPDCEKRVSSINKYCGVHRIKVEKGLPLDRNCIPKGSNHYLWKGGIFAYPNHYAMKKVRKKLIKKYGLFCMDCGIQKESCGLHLHHLDKTKDNHDEDNFKLLCPKCHRGIYHLGESYKKRYIMMSSEKIMKKLNMEPDVLAAKLGVNRSTVSRWTYLERKGGTGGHIPWKYHHRIRQIAKRAKVVLEATDFVEV